MGEIPSVWELFNHIECLVVRARWLGACEERIKIRGPTKYRKEDLSAREGSVKYIMTEIRRELHKIDNLVRNQNSQGETA